MGVGRGLQAIVQASPNARRGLRANRLRLAVADADQEVRFDRGAGEERRIHAGIVEAGHRAAVQPDRPRRQQQVCALQGGVAERGGVDQRLVADEPAARVSVRKQPRQLLVEFVVGGDDRGDRRLHGLGAVAIGQERLQLRLRRLRLHEHHPHRRAVRAGRPELGQVVELVQLLVAHLFRQPRVERAGAAEQLLKTGLGKQLAHRYPLGKDAPTVTLSCKCIGGRTRTVHPWGERTVFILETMPRRPRAC